MWTWSYCWADAKEIKVAWRTTDYSWNNYACLTRYLQAFEGSQGWAASFNRRADRWQNGGSFPSLSRSWRFRRFLLGATAVAVGWRSRKRGSYEPTLLQLWPGIRDETTIASRRSVMRQQVGHRVDRVAIRRGRPRKVACKRPLYRLFELCAYPGVHRVRICIYLLSLWAYFGSPSRLSAR